MATLVVDAYEGFDVEIFYVPGAYLNADMFNDKYVRLKFEGELLDIIFNVNSDHIQNIQYENRNKVLLLRIMKALYGLIE